jgi:predicted O-methyltransferase YrrM
LLSGPGFKIGCMSDQKAAAVLNDIEKISAIQGLPIIGPQKGRVLVDAVKRYKPKNILEIGTLVGYSSILMSGYLADGGRITTIDINPEIVDVAEENLEEAGLSGKVDFLVGDAVELIPKIDGPFDMLFLDAAKEDYLQYLLLSERILSPRAVVIADNVGIFSDVLSEFLDYVRHSGGYKSQNIDFGFDAVEVSVRSP